MKRTEKIKNHFRENKKVYLGCGVTALIAAGTTVLLVSRQNGTQIAQPFSWKPRAEINHATINMIERSTPSKPVHLVGTNLYYNSMSEAARETGISVSRISRHINDGSPLADGSVFEVLEAAS